MAGQDDLEFKILANDESAAVVEKAAARAEALEKKSPTVKVTADDKASGDLDEIEAKARALNAADPQVEVDVDAAEADAKVRELAARLAGLTDDQQEVVLKAQVANAEGDIKRLQRSLQGFRDMSDEEVQVRLRALDLASDDLRAARRLLDDLDGRRAEVKVDSSGLDTALSKLGELDGATGKIASGLGTLSAGGGVATGVAAIAVGLALAGEAAADTAISAQSLATLTGDTVEDASRLQQVWQRSGADVQDLADVALQVQQALAQSPEIAAQLGIDLRDGATGGQRLAQVLERVRNFTGSAAEKAQLMSTVFGEEGARQAAALLSIVQDIPKALQDVDPKLVITDEAVDAAREYKTAVAEAKAQFQGLATEIGQNVVPAAADLLGILNDIAGIKIGGQGIFDIGGYNAIKSAIESDDIDVKFAAPNLDPFLRQTDALQQGAEDAQTATDGWAGAVENLADQMADAKQKADELHDTQRRATDSQYAAEASARDLAQALLEYGQKVKDAKGDQFELASITDDLREKTIASADAQVQAAKDMATRLGVTLEAKDAERIWRDSMITTAAFMDGPQRQSILDYINNVEGIPEKKATEIAAALANGDVEEAKRLLNEAAAGPYDATIDVFVDPALANAKTTLDLIDGMTARATVQITSVLRGEQGINGGRAAGGGTAPGGVYRYGEGGRPEAWVDAFGNAYVLPDRNGSIRPLEQVAAATTPGGNVVQIINYPPGVGARDVSRAQRTARQRGFGRPS